MILLAAGTLMVAGSYTFWYEDLPMAPRRQFLNDPETLVAQALEGSSARILTPTGSSPRASSQTRRPSTGRGEPGATVRRLRPAGGLPTTPGPRRKGLSIRTTPPFRADHVGSLLRPKSLLDARAEHEAGRLSAEQLRAEEDAAIRDVVALQQEVGLRAITDGELRRGSWHMDFIYEIGGVERIAGQPAVDVPQRAGHDRVHADQA